MSLFGEMWGEESTDLFVQLWGVKVKKLSGNKYLSKEQIPEKYNELICSDWTAVDGVNCEGSLTQGRNIYLFILAFFFFFGSPGPGQAWLHTVCHYLKPSQLLLSIVAHLSTPSLPCLSLREHSYHCASGPAGNLDRDGGSRCLYLQTEAKVSK